MFATFTGVYTDAISFCKSHNRRGIIPVDYFRVQSSVSKELNLQNVKLEKETRALRQRVVQLHDQIGMDQMTEIDVENIQQILYPNAAEFQQEVTDVLKCRQDSRICEDIVPPDMETNAKTTEVIAVGHFNEMKSGVSANAAEVASPKSTTNSETDRLQCMAEDERHPLPSIAIENEDRFSGKIEFRNTVRQTNQHAVTKLFL